MSGESNNDEVRVSPRPWLRRADQACAMIVVVVSLIAMAGFWLTHGGPVGGVIDLDTAPHRNVRFQIDINQAEPAEFALLPGVGKVLAGRIVEHRAEHGPFSDHQQLRRVKGIGPKTLARIQPYLLPIPLADVVDK